MIDATMTTRLPRGPRGRWWPTLQLIRNPRRAFAKWTCEFGDPFLLNALNGPVVVTGRADLIREVFGNEPDQYDVFALDTTRPILGDGSVLLMSGPTHRRERKLLLPLFQGERMKAYGGMMQAVAIRCAETSLHRKRVSALKLTTAVSLEVIARAIFGGDDQETTDEFVAAARELVRRSSPLLFFSKKMQFRLLGLSLWDRFERAQQRLNAAFDRQLQRPSPVGGNRVDILGLLQAARYDDGSVISTPHLKHELSTLLFAGHETTAIALAWAIYHIHRNPDVLGRLRQSIENDGDSPEELARNPYLKAVIQETLRLNPIITEVLRLLKVPMKLDSFVIPAGHAIAPATAIAHYNPTTYPEPDRFRPQRFLERSYSPFEFFPFGGGHRRCVGAAFSTYEMAIVLGTWIYRYQFELLETADVVSKRRNVTMGPSTGIPVRIERRAPGHSDDPRQLVQRGSDT